MTSIKKFKKADEMKDGIEALKRQISRALRNGQVSTRWMKVYRIPGLVPMNRKERWQAILEWLPSAYAHCNGDCNALIKLARLRGFYSEGTGYFPMLWHAMEVLKLK